MDNNSNSEVVSLYLDDIIPNRFQPREVFDDQALKELAVSIKEHGVIQPIIVRKVDDKYEIIAGERRYKASTMAGLTKIPAIVKNLDDKESSKVALIENLQRKDLTPIEEARTYQKILELEDNMTQEQLAATMGKTQSSVSNKLRLLSLPDEIQDALLKEKISERHARSLLNIEDKNEQIKMMERVVSEKLTVRELDKIIKDMKNGGTDSETGGGVNIEIGNSIPAVASISPAITPEAPTVSENLTANDIAGEVTTTPADATSLINDNSNNALPTLNLASIGLGDIKEENKEENKESTPEVNPTVVDINQIRENSVDIGGNNLFNKPVTDVIAEAVTEAPQEKTTTGTDDAYKFVPSINLGGNNNANNTSEPEQATEAPVNRFSGFFNTNVNHDTESNQTSNNVASTITPIGITVETPAPGVDLTPAKDDVKNVINSLKEKGYNVSFEENDGATDYKITITLQK